LTASFQTDPNKGKHAFIPQIPLSPADHFLPVKMIRRQFPITLSFAFHDNAENIDNYPMEFLNSISIPGLPPHELRLKKNAIVMLLRNLNVERGLCNGTRLIVNEMGDNAIDCIVPGDSGGLHSGQHVFVPRIPLTPPESYLPVKMTRRQFPITLSFAMTFVCDIALDRWQSSVGFLIS
jgi:hypothetical protein